MEALHVVGGELFLTSEERCTPVHVPYLHVNVHVQGHLAHQKMPTPLGPPWDPPGTLGMGIRYPCTCVFKKQAFIEQFLDFLRNKQAFLESLLIF